MAKIQDPNLRKASCPGLFWVFFGGGGFRLPGPLSQNTRTLNREADELHLSNYITPRKLIPKIRLIIIPGKLIQIQLKSVSVSVIFVKLIRKHFKSACNNFGSVGNRIAAHFK